MKFKFRNVLFAAPVYVYLAVVLGVVAPILLLGALAYVVAAMLTYRWMLRGAERRRNESNIAFSKSGPAEAFGVQHASFHYVFESKQDVLRDLQKQLNDDLVGKLGCAEMRAVEFQDIDTDLMNSEARTFLVAQGRATARATQPTILVDLKRAAELNTVRWWVLMRGVRDPNKVFWRYVFAPVFVPTVVWAYARRRYSPLPGTLTIDPGFFNSIDVLNNARQIEYVAFEALVRTMERFGLDTSDLRSQRGSILNINVTGGKANFGSVVQGAMNTIRGEAKGMNT